MDKCRVCGAPVLPGEEFFASNPPQHLNQRVCIYRLRSENEALRLAIGDNYGWIYGTDRRPVAYWKGVDQALKMALAEIARRNNLNKR